MEIDTKRFTVMIVGLAVAIILVSGLMVPVISSLGGSGTYTNTGEYYYKTPVEGETHTMSTTSADYSITTITYDENTIELTGDSAYVLPLVLYTSSTTGHDILFEVSYAPDIINGVATPYAEAALVDLNEMDSELWYDYTINIDGTDITVRWGSGENQYETGTVKFFLANEGEYVLSESPVIGEDMTYYLADMYQEMRDPAQGGDTNYGIVSAGTSTEVTTPPFPTIYKMSDYQLDFSGVTTQIDKTENEYGIKMNGIEIHSVWKNSTDATQTIDIDWTAKKMIVPVTVESDGGSGISDTLMSLISVIPLITVVGIVLGAITIFRRN